MQVQRFIIAFFTTAVLLFSNCLQAQDNKKVIGIGASFGATNYMGELDDNLSMQFTKEGYGVHATYPLFPFADVRANLFHGKVSADDAVASNSNNIRRNLSFRSAISEFGINLILKYPRKESKNYKSEITPYLFGGVALFHFNPQAYYEGKWVDLQPLGTEGQFLPGENYPQPYKLEQIALPFGAGVEYKLSENLSFGFETGMRKTFTDYLDDVSGKYPDKELLREQRGQMAFDLSDRSDKTNHPDGKASFSKRGNQGTMDWYIYTNVHFTYYFSAGHFLSFLR